MALLLYAAIPARASTHWVDYDTDDDGLIDVTNIAQLNMLRYDHNGDGFIWAENILVPLSERTEYNAAYPNRQTVSTPTSTAPRMGCPGVCTGYELMNDLDFAAPSQQSWDSTDWPYQGIFEGNGYVLRNMNQTIASGQTSGFIGVLTANGVVRNVGLIDATVTSNSQTIGILAGTNRGTITASYVRGGSVAFTGSVNPTIGGLAGRIEQGGAITASYSTATVDAGSNDNGRAGGLVGELRAGTITASFAAGNVTGTDAAGSDTLDFGGLVGEIHDTATATSIITDSYCAVDGRPTACIGEANGAASAVPVQTESELQTPTGYTGIYENWNVDLDGDAIPDNPWYFGTTSAYPVITDPKTTEPPAANRRTIDHDSDNDGLIEVDTLQKLNAIRHDLDGDGLPASTTTYAAYVSAFVGGDLTAATATRMGCVSGCIGYELTRNLDFAADGVAVTSTDPYPNWTPIASYESTLDGNGNTITRLTINGAAANAGLFAALTGDAVIRDLGIIAPNVTSTAAAANAGALAGNNGGKITAVYADGGSVTVSGATAAAGGLVGENSGPILAAWSTAAVTAGAATGGGLIGKHSGELTTGYAAGAVSGSGNNIGGLVGVADTAGAAIAAAYCDTTATTQSNCIGDLTNNAAATSTGYATAALQTPTGYTGIYESWNIDLDGDGNNDYPWNFGEATQYPTLYTPTERQARIEAGEDTLPPPLPRTIPPEPEREYDPAADHPEIYNNAEYEMAATCQTRNVDPETGNPQAATVTFDLGSYTGPILLHLSIWANGRYMAYETQGIALPTLERNGQRASVRVETDPAQTRFRLDGRRHGLAANLLLGYADCRSDDP